MTFLVFDLLHLDGRPDARPALRAAARAARGAGPRGPSWQVPPSFGSATGRQCSPPRPSRGSRAWSPSGATRSTAPAGAPTPGSRSRTCAPRRSSSAAGSRAPATARARSARCCSAYRADDGLHVCRQGRHRLHATPRSRRSAAQLAPLEVGRLAVRRRGAAGRRPGRALGATRGRRRGALRRVDPRRTAAAPGVAGAATRTRRRATWCARPDAASPHRARSQSKSSSRNDLRRRWPYCPWPPPPYGIFDVAR